MAQTFTTSDLIEQVHEQTGFNASDSKKAVDAVFGLIEKGLLLGNKYVIRGFGTFEIKKRKARTGRNFETKQPVEIPAREVPVATIAEVLVNKYLKK